MTGEIRSREFVTFGTIAHNLYPRSVPHVTKVTPLALPKPRKKILPKVSVAGRIERGYYEDLVAIIDADDHFGRIGDFVREAVMEKVQHWKKEHPLAVQSTGRRSRDL